MTLKDVLKLHENAIKTQGLMVILSSDATDDRNKKVYSVLHSQYMERLGAKIVAQTYEPGYCSVVSDQEFMNFTVEAVNGTEEFLHLLKTEIFKKEEAS